MISIALPIWCKILGYSFCSGETKLGTFSQISSALDSRDTDYTNFTFKACPSSKHGQAHLCDLANIAKKETFKYVGKEENNSLEMFQ